MGQGREDCRRHMWMDPKGTLDALDVVDLERLFPEEDFPYTSDFAIPFMAANSISNGFYEEEQEDEAEHRGYKTGWRASKIKICTEASLIS